MLRNQTALESLVQRGKSTFFTELVSVFEKSQNALLEPYNASELEILSKLKRIGFDVEIKKIIEKNLNFPIRLVDIYESPHTNLRVFMRFTEESKKEIRDTRSTKGMMKEKIAKFYNDREGSISKDSRSSPIYGVVLFETGLWSVRNTDGSFYLSPSELAAVTLHEIGHLDHYIRALGGVHYRAIDASDIVTYIGKSPDKDLIDQLLKEIEGSPFLDKSWSKVLESCKTYFRTTNNPDDPVYIEALSTLSALVAADTASRNLVTFNMLLDFTLRDSKVYTSTLDVDAERQADEFSARQGSYASLVSAIKKMWDLYQTKSELRFKRNTNYLSTSILSAMTEFKTMFNIAAEDITNGYDPVVRRMELIVETAKHAFHDEMLPQDAKEDIEQQIRTAEAYIADYKSTNHYKVRSSLKQWKDNVGKFGRIIASPFQNRMIQDYHRLQEANRSLNRHPLYYLAKKDQ